MNLARFIANKMIRGGSTKDISRPIVRIATIGIAVGMALMLLSTAIVKGFQKEIRNKVIGFGSHFQITANERSHSKDSQKLIFDPEVYNTLKATEHVRHVQVFATKPGILETKESIQGVIIKGVGEDFDWDFIRSCLKEGSLLDSAEKNNQYSLLISTYIARRMKLKVGDKTSLYIFNDNADPRQRNFIIKGIYETGLEDFDAQFVFTKIDHVQRLSGWGLRVEAQVDSGCYSGARMVGAYAFGGEGAFEYQWTDPEWEGEGPHALFAESDTTIRVIAKDDAKTIPDTAWISLDVKDSLDASGCPAFTYHIKSTGGSDQHYIGGYEVLIDDYDYLLKADDAIFGSLTSKFLQTQKITDRNPEIFSWLEMLDINVLIIIVLMVVISIVNMTSALLIIILERQNMIGTLKALGILDRTVMRIFLNNAISIIGKGVLWGNIFGLGIAYLQWQFGFLSLNPENYYVTSVPIDFDVMSFLELNVITLGICSLSMSLPALYVLRINPVKAMRFS